MDLSAAKGADAAAETRAVEDLDGSAERVIDGDDDLDPHDTVLKPVVDMDICVDDGMDPTTVAATISCAVRGLLEGLLPSIFLTSVYIAADRGLEFTTNQQPDSPPIDRLGSTSVLKKPKRKKSPSPQRKFSVYGASRAPSRASSITPSYAGAISMSIRSSALAKRLSQTSQPALEGTNPFQITPWNETSGIQGAPSSRHRGSIVGASSWNGDGATARGAVDIAEMQRRGDIERDISTREARRRLTQVIQRKGELKLKMRSMADPTISLEKEAAIEAAGNRSGASRLGSRASTRVIPPLSSLMNAGQSPTAEEPITFRTEDYQGISSSIVLLGGGGEVLVGDNCFVIARKPRQEIHGAFSRQDRVAPRINMRASGSQEPEAQDAAPDKAMPLEATSQPRSAVKTTRSKVKAESKVVQIYTDPAFEGHIGSFKQYPRLEMDPSKTQLTEGVALKSPEPNDRRTAVSNQPGEHKGEKAGSSSPQAVADAKATAKKSSPKAKPQPPQSKTSLNSDKDAANAEDLSNKAMQQQTARPSPSTKLSGAESPVLPKHTQHLHSLRTRTPATEERRPTTTKQVKNRFNLEELEESPADSALQDSEQAERNTNSLTSSTNMSQNGPIDLPRVKYVREFPSPPTGKIRIFGSVPAFGDPVAGNDAPFSSMALPRIIKGKR